MINANTATTAEVSYGLVRTKSVSRNPPS